jgi:NAD(P)-dependent dehydrogenase (short-subunit alcohol dehydrogenase family)
LNKEKDKIMNDKQIAMVTGAAKGIGLAIAERLIHDGFLVIGVDVDESAGKELCSRWNNGPFAFYRADISAESEVVKLFENVHSDYGKLDVLVNNAGIIRDNFIINMPSDDFDLVLRVNLKGSWLMCKEAAKIMKQQKSGRIVNISSRAWLGNAGQSNYSASKAGIVSLTRVLALEMGRYNVVVNAVAPGLIDTDLSRSLKQEVLQRLIESQPTKQMGKPEDVANAVSFLASPVTGFITGQVIYVDGGKSIGAGL